MKRSGSTLTLFLFVTVLVFLWILAGWNTDNYDYSNYSARYGYVLSGGFNPIKLDFGYDLIEYVFGLFGARFEQFRVWIYGIGVLIIGTLIWKWSIHPVWALVFYICFHFLRDTVETRNFIASLFVLLTINYYGKTDKWHHVFIALLLFMSFSIHMAFILYLPFLLIDFKQIRWNYWIILLISACLSFFAQRLLAGSIGLIDFEGIEDKISNFLSISPTFAFAVAIIKAIFNGVCVTFFYNNLQRAAELGSIRINHLRASVYSRIMYNMNALTCFMIVFTPISGSFYTRLFGNVLILNIIYFLNVLSWVKKDKIWLTILLVIYMLFYIFTSQIIPFQEHLDYLLNNNSILFD